MIPVPSLKDRHGAMPLILNFDHAVGEIPGSTTLDLTDWQERIRYGCSRAVFDQLSEYIDSQTHSPYDTVLMGSGDYHHITLLLLERLAQRYSQEQPIEVVVFDNHPDNMRFPFGVHCGSWVQHVARLPFVQHVHVIGITSADIGAAHAWENHWLPLYRRKLSYWCLQVNVDWAKYVGLGHAFHRFEDADALVQGFIQDYQSRQPSSIYLSIDKDVFAPNVAQTNWDQGVLQEAHVMRIVDALQGRLIGSDITGEISTWQYATWWKRWMSALDGQAPPALEQLAVWQSQHHQLNTRLIAALHAASMHQDRV